MIGPKAPKPSPADEKRAYDDCTTRDRGTCVRCGYYGPENQRDHRQNRQPGNTIVSNLQLLCGPHFVDWQLVPGCHHWKTHNVTAATLEGFTVPGWVERSRIAFWPAWRADVNSWVVYYDAPNADGDWWDEITDATADILMREAH